MDCAVHESRDATASCAIHQLFELRAEDFPHAIALECDGLGMSYGELNFRANLQAHALMALGVKKDHVIGLFLERSAEMVIGLLAILKAGCCYLPLDPHLPEERLRRIVVDSQVAVLLTRRSLVHKLPPTGSKVLFMGERTGSHPIRSDNPSLPASAGDLAYVIYTSGSTGNPKGVMIKQEALSNVLMWAAKTLGLDARDRLLATTTISFDIAALELFLPLTLGARVVLMPTSKFNPKLIATRMLLGDITVMQATPSLWDSLADELPQNIPGELTILSGGEPLGRETAAKLLRLGRSVWNLYGPTETTIWSSACRIERADGVLPIGKPIAETTMYLLNDRGQPVPDGDVGNLYIGGVGLARGYWANEELTHERFIVMYVGGAYQRLYRTGDLARVRADGNFEFAGRVDAQVKIRGHRVELGEIEASLREHPQVREAAVVLLSERNQVQQLVAYVVLHRECSTTGAELRSFVESRLPEYMLPARFIVVSAMPLTPSGKLDRAVLASGAQPISESVPFCAGTSLQMRLVPIWTDLLHLQNVSIDDNFFELGGDSVSATRLMARISGVLGMELLPRLLYDKPTIRGLAEWLESEIDAQSAPISLGDPRQRSQTRPSRERRRSWYLNPFDGLNSSYGTPCCIRLFANLEPDHVYRGLVTMLSQLEAPRTLLNTGVSASSDKPGQNLVDLVDLDLRGSGVACSVDEVWHRAQMDPAPDADNSAVPLLRSKLLRLAEQEYMLCIAAHYRVAQNWPSLPLFQEVVSNFGVEASLQSRVRHEIWVHGGGRG